MCKLDNEVESGDGRLQTEGARTSPQKKKRRNSLAQALQTLSMIVRKRCQHSWVAVRGALQDWWRWMLGGKPQHRIDRKVFRPTPHCILHPRGLLQCHFGISSHTVPQHHPSVPHPPVPHHRRWCGTCSGRACSTSLLWLCPGRTARAPPPPGHGKGKAASCSPTCLM